MTDRAAELALQLADECGALAAFALVREVRRVVGDKGFAATDLCLAARTNGDLRAAIVAACDDSTPRRLGAFLSRWQGVAMGPLIVRAVGKDAAGTIWTCDSEPPGSHTREHCTRK